MEIIDNTSETTSLLSALDDGTVFQYDSITYMKITTVGGNNAVNLATGVSSAVAETLIVTVPTASLTLTN